MRRGSVPLSTLSDTELNELKLTKLLAASFLLYILKLYPSNLHLTFIPICLRLSVLLNPDTPSIVTAVIPLSTPGLLHLSFCLL